MPFAVPYPSFPLQQSNLPATPVITLGTTITASSTTHTKGSWTSLIDPLSFDTQMIALFMSDVQTNATDTKVLVDIGVGPTGGGSEQVVVPNLSAAGIFSANQGGRTLVLPMRLMRGQRVSARCQALIASDTVRVGIAAYGGFDQVPWPTFTKATDYGTDTANSRGTSHTAGNTGAESTWANFGSTTSHDHKAWLLMSSGPSGTTWNSLAYHFEFGANSTAYGEYWFCTGTSENVTGPWPGTCVYREVPAGTQMQVRGECSGTAQAHYLSLYGLS